MGWPLDGGRDWFGSWLSWLLNGGVKAGAYRPVHFGIKRVFRFICSDQVKSARLKRVFRFIFQKYVFFQF